MRFGAQFPQPGVGLVVQLERAVADFLERFEIFHAGHAHQPVVDKGLHRAEHDLAIGVMLFLAVGGIAHAHRAHAAIAAKRIRFALFQPRIAAHVVERLDIAGLAAVDDVAQIFEIGFQHVQRADAVQRLDRIIGIAHPAVAIVPVAATVRMFGNGGGQRRHDRAGILMLAELERDRRADHRFLIFGRGGQPAHPAAPFAQRIVQHLFQSRLDRIGKTLVRAQKEIHVALHAKGILLRYQPDRGVGGQAHRHGIDGVADMVGAVAAVHLVDVPAGCRAQAHADARASGDGAYDPHKGIGPVNAPLAAIARREVDDVDRAAMIVRLARDQHR